MSLLANILANSSKTSLTTELGNMESIGATQMKIWHKGVVKTTVEYGL